MLPKLAPSSNEQLQEAVMQAGGAGLFGPHRIACIFVLYYIPNILFVLFLHVVEETKLVSPLANVPFRHRLYLSAAISQVSQFGSYAALSKGMGVRGESTGHNEPTPGIAPWPPKPPKTYEN